MVKMPNICDYTDYREFLKDHYREVKARNPNYSYQVLSMKAGFKSKGFLHNVIQGKRPISKKNIFGLSQALKLNKWETDYFENLVAFNRATRLQERNFYFERLSSIKTNGKTAWKPQVVRKDQFEFYSRLYNSVIRSIIDLHGFMGDYAWLAKMVIPRITPGQARKAVELMEKLGLIKKGKDGTYMVSEKSIATPPEIKTLAVLNFHRQSGELALKALSDLPREQRNMTGTTLGISKETYNRICDEITAFRTKLLEIAEADKKADTVYQLNFQFFPVSTKKSEGRSA
jgi:uncharacterized protein (TIGR02147 family)